MFSYKQIPILTDDSIRVLALKTSNPKITVFEIAAKTLIPIQGSAAQSSCATTSGRYGR